MNMLYSLFHRHLNKSIPYKNGDKDQLKDALKKANATSILEGVSLMDVEIGRAEKFLQISADLRVLQMKASVSDVAVR
jgi:hypothetical protein